MLFVLRDVWDQRPIVVSLRRVEEMEWESETIDIVPPGWKVDDLGLSEHVEIEVREFGKVLFMVVVRVCLCFLGIVSFSSWMQAMSEDVIFMSRARVSILSEFWGWIPFMFRERIRNESGEDWVAGDGGLVGRARL